MAARTNQSGHPQDALGAPAPAGDLGMALTLLAQGLDALAALPPGWAAQERATHDRAVTQLMQALRSTPLPLPQAPPLVMDDRRLARLLDLAGPTHSAELLMHLDQDLARVAQSLGQAAHLADAGAIRAETHILITLAGSVGALGLEQDARALNQIAHDQGGAIGPAAAEKVRQGLDQLCQLISARRQAFKTGP